MTEHLVLFLGVCTQWLEPECDASVRAVIIVPYQCRHLGHEGAMAVCGHGVLCLLLAHRGPLELLHQLLALVMSR